MAFAETVVQVVDTLKLILLYGWWIIILAVIWGNKYKWSKFPLDVVIFEKRGENLIKTNDRAGKFYDKHADMTFYKLYKTGDTIPVYDFNWIIHNNPVHTNLLERYINLIRGNTGTIFLFRYGSKQYKPINVKTEEGIVQKFVPAKNEKGEKVYVNQYINFDPRKMFGLIDFEVIDWDNMNFMVQEQRASLIRRMRKSDYWKQTLIPLVIIAGAIIASIFILKFSYDAGTDLRGMQFEQAQQKDTTQTGEQILDKSIVGSAINDVAPAQ